MLKYQFYMNNFMQVKNMNSFNVLIACNLVINYNFSFDFLHLTFN